MTLMNNVAEPRLILKMLVVKGRGTAAIRKFGSLRSLLMGIRFDDPSQLHLVGDKSLLVSVYMSPIQHIMLKTRVILFLMSTDWSN